MPPPDESLATYSEDEIAVVFADLFPQGWAGADVLQELAPEGWERSPFVKVWHPSAEQLHQEMVRMMENLAPTYSPSPLPNPQIPARLFIALLQIQRHHLNFA